MSRWLPVLLTGLLPAFLLLASSPTGEPTVLLALAIGILLLARHLVVFMVAPRPSPGRFNLEVQLPPLIGQPGRAGRPLPRAPGAC